MVKKHISEISIGDMTRIASEAGKEARQKALDEGLEVASGDYKGNIIIDNKDENGEINIQVKPKDKNT